MEEVGEGKIVFDGNSRSGPAKVVLNGSVSEISPFVAVKAPLLVIVRM